MTFLIHSILILGIPYLIINFEKKIKVIELIGPVVCAYILGIFLGNIPGFWQTSIAKTFSEITVILAIPMLLLATDLPGWVKLAKTTIFSFLLLVVSVMVVGFVSGLLFRGYDPELWKMVGMVVGVYVGGTPNLTAIGKILEIRDDVFITLNAVDLAIGGLYLLVIMSIGVKILTRFLKPFEISSGTISDYEISNWKNLRLINKFKNTSILILICLMVVGLSIGLVQLFLKYESVGPIIFGVTLFSIGLSLYPKIRNLEGSQEIGHFLLLCFCFSVGSLANLDNIFTGKIWYFLFCSFILFGSVILHFLLCFVFKIDRDTAIITSTAGIFGPAFIAPMSDVLKNRAMLVSGITCGLVGIAIGNFVGVWVAYLLK